MSPKTDDQNSKIKDERREQILMAGLKVFARRGLAATKISDIAGEAGLSHGLLYHYFRSKEDLFAELVNTATATSSTSMLEVEALPLEPMEKIKRIASLVSKFINESEETAYFFMMMIHATVSEVNPPEVKEYLQRSRIPLDVMARIIAEGQEKGQIRDGNPNEYAWLFWAAINGLAIYKISQGPDFTMPDPDFLIRIF